VAEDVLTLDIHEGLHDGAGKDSLESVSPEDEVFWWRLQIHLRG
jgi:hypothetical protein